MSSQNILLKFMTRWVLIFLKIYFMDYAITAVPFRMGTDGPGVGEARCFLGEEPTLGWRDEAVHYDLL